MTIINHSFRLAMGMAIAGALGGTALAQQSIANYLGISYSQNFNNTSNPWADNNGFANPLSNASGNQTTRPTGWMISEDGGSNIGNYTRNSGSSAADLHSYGSSNASTERALGSEANTANSMFGVTFVNNTGATITSIYIQYDAEVWLRPGNQGRGDDRLNFQYSQTIGSDIFGMSSSSWLNAQDSIDFAVVRDTPSSTTVKSGFISVSGGINIAPGGTFAIRWVDSNGSGNEWGLAIDNLLVMVPEPWQPALISGLGLVGLVAWKRRQASYAR